MNSEYIDKKKSSSCYHCGKCTSGCEVNKLDPSFQPHKILHLISEGAPEELLNGDALWKCTTCFTCSERCPQGIGVTDVLWTLRALATKSGRFLDLIVAQRETLLTTGRLYPAGPLDAKKREKAGLPPLSKDSSVVSLIFEAAKADTPS
jgi:heterodisulfide reductase subunit C